MRFDHMFDTFQLQIFLAISNLKNKEAAEAIDESINSGPAGAPLTIKFEGSFGSI